MKLVKIAPSTNPKKKYDAVFRLDDGKEKIVRFGAAGYTDYTLSHDEVKKQAYLARHKSEDWNNPLTAGALSRWILWNKPTVRGSVIDFRNRFNL
jgi:hypothetical protein